MVTYRIQAPNGQTYRIDGPEGASDEDIRAQVLAQHPEADKPDQAATEAAGTRDFRAGERATLPDAPKTTGRRVLDAAAYVAKSPFEMVGGVRRALEGKVLGARQFAAGVTGEDEEQLRQRAMQLEAENKNASATSKVGEFVGSVAPEMMVGGPVGRMVSGAVKAAPAAIRGLTSLVGSGAAGAADAMLNPETGEYNIADKAKSGAEWGVGGNLVGRAAGRIYAPFRGKGGGDAQQNAALMNANGLPNQYPATQTDSKMIQAATNALEQIDPTGTMSKLRNQNYEWGTRLFTKPTGTEVSVLSQSARDAMDNNLRAQARKFDAVPGTVVAPTPAADLEEANRAVRRFASEPGTAIPMKGGPPLHEVTMEDLLHLRSAATKLSDAKAGGAMPSPELAKDFRNIREMYDQAILDRLPARPPPPAPGAPSPPHPSGLPTKEDYTEWLDKWGAFQVVKQAREKGTSGGRLLPQNIEAVMGDTFASGDPAKRLASAMAENMPTPPSGWNRAAITAALLGATPAAGGVASDLTRGDPGVGTAAGLGVSAALISGLMRKAPSQAQTDELRRRITAFMLAAGNNRGN